MRIVAVYSIVALMLACPVAAYAKDGAESSKAVKSATPFDHEAFADEVAERIRAKALFNADVIPQLQRVIDKTSERRTHDHWANEIAENLWQLRAAPETQKRFLDTILAADTFNDFRKAINETKRFVEKTVHIARSLQQREDGKLREKRGQMSDQEYRLHSMAERLETEKRRESAMSKAARIAAALKEADLRRRDAEPFLTELGKLEANPETLKAAISLIKKRDIPRERIIALLEKLAISPKEAMADIANIAELNEVNEQLRFAVSVESQDSMIKLPIAAVLPKAAEELAKVKTIPLATSTFKRTGKLLHTRRIEKALLIDAEYGLPLRSEQKGENEHVVFLNPGERLYIVNFRPVPFALTGADTKALAAYVPHILEYGEDTRQTFERILTNTAGPIVRSMYVIAAACGPEELRAHFASLAVVRSEREKSLYGPFEDFTWKREDASYDYRELSSIPADSPGTALRLVDICDPDLFLALAPLADKEGLERLMGPIRGIWVRNWPEEKNPWLELRYTPTGKTKGFVLGESPVLELNKAALESIIAAKRSFLEYAWATYAVREEAKKESQDKNRAAKPDYDAKLPEALKIVAEEFEAMAKKGFVSPWDMGSARFYLRRAGNDAALIKILEALRDDVSQSSAKRVRAMRSASQHN